MGGLLLRAKFSFTYPEHRLFYARLTTKRKILGNPLRSTLILSLILQRRLSTSICDSKSARSPPASLVVYGGLLMKNNVFSLLLFCSRSFEQALVFWGRFWKAGEYSSSSFCKVRRCQRPCLGDFDGWLIVACRTTAEKR
jgi:hypothetical protein